MEQKGNADGRQVLLAGKALSQLPLPVPGLRAKRGHSDENQPPTEQKRARRLPVPTRRVAASIATTCSKASAATAIPRTQRAGHRASLRPGLTIPAASVADIVRRPVPVAAVPKMAAPALAAGNEGKKRAAWDLKGQLSDMRTKVSSYKDKVQRLDGENQQLKRQLQEQVVQNQELSSQVSTLSSALHTCQEQAQQRLHKVMELSDLKQQLEEQVTSHNRTIRQLEGTKRDLSSLLETRESHFGRDRKGDVKYDFIFDRVFSPACSQEEVFEEIALLVQSALDGYNVCIFAYGQTGSGKTYTMEGPDDMSPETMGMIPRAVRQVFQGAQELEPKGWQYRFTANFLEIYNESLRDLLVGRPERGAELEIKRVSQSSEELHVPNLRYVPVDSEDEVLKLLQTAKANRSVAKTALNDRSSRSHSLFQLRIEGWNRSRDLHSVSVLSLVDLAGSERLDKSFSKGERLRETQAINTSLSTLGLVIMALSNKEPHIPYRNSKLTYLLQNSLGGNSKMLMFVNISPLEENLSESLNSLRFASKVNECVIGTAQANRK
ncbi:kinesin-like protein KIFC1 isoform X2 [Eretmochelys imbricata]